MADGFLGGLAIQGVTLSGVDAPAVIPDHTLPWHRRKSIKRADVLEPLFILMLALLLPL